MMRNPRLAYLTPLFILSLLPTVLAAQASLFEEHKLLASDGVGADLFGDSVTLSGDTIVVGAREGNVDSGFAYVFERDAAGIWREVRKLTASDTAPHDFFGDAVGLSGDTLVVGASFDDDAGENSGSVYVFERHHGGQDNWGEVKKLTASDGAPSDQFGKSLVIRGDTIVVGAELSDPAGNASGSAYIFARHHGGQDNWGEVRKLTASDAVVGGDFGRSVAISGDTIAVGSNGAAYLFERNHGGAENWGEVRKLTAPNADTSFGRWVDVSGDTLVVTAPADDDAATNAGAAYVFERHHGGQDNWGQLRKLLASDATTHDLLGFVAALDGDTIVLGAHFVDEQGVGPGAAYVYERHRGGAQNWGEAEKLTTSDGAAGDEFGHVVAVDGGTVVAGARLDDDAGFNAGSAYVFEAASATLSLPASIPVPSNLPVNVPVTFTGDGREIAAVAFSIDFDETCLAFDPTDGDGDGIPDAVLFTVPASFSASVTFAASDTLGELDFVIADFSTPLASLPDGVVVTIALSPICIPVDTNLLAPVRFGAAPAASFGDIAGQSVPGSTADGSVEILSGVPGDCNGDGAVDAGDISACVLEVFDGDGNVWTDVVSGTFLGTPVGCDANQDFLVDAGDLSCKILLIFSGACSPPSARLSSALPELRLGRSPSSGVGQEVQISLTFTGHGHSVTAGAFSIDFDETCLAFDPADGDGDGLPDDISFTLPAGMTPSVSVDASRTGGELNLSFLDPVLPFTPLRDAVIASITFTQLCAAAHTEPVAAVRFGDAVPLSFGDESGRGIPGIGLGGGVTFGSPIFVDDFESGDTSRWFN